MKGEEHIKKRMPWLAKGAVDWLENNLTKDFKILEFGSGGSTLFFAERCKEVITIENNKKFYDLILDYINKNKISNITISFIGKGSKLFYEEKEYDKIINNYPDNYFDLILIDPNGIDRNRIVETAIRKLKPDGYLVLDNYEWFLENPETRWHTPSFFGKDFKGWKASIFDDKDKKGKGTVILKKSR